VPLPPSCGGLGAPAPGYPGRHDRRGHHVMRAGPFCAICQDIAEKGYEGLVLTRH